MRAIHGAYDMYHSMNSKVKYVSLYNMFLSPIEFVLLMDSVYITNINFITITIILMKNSSKINIIF